MERKSFIMGAAFVVLAAILWGLDGIVLTPRLYNLSTPFVVFLLHAIPFIILNIFMFNEYKRMKEFNPKDLGVFMLIALFGGAIGTLAIVKALFLVNFQHLSIVILLQKTQPIFAILLARIILKEKLRQHFMEWAFLGMIAVYFLTFGWNLPSLNPQGTPIQAIIYTLVAAVSFGSATVFGRFVAMRYEFQEITFYRYGFTTLLVGIYLVLNGEFFPFQQITQLNWIIFIIITFTTGMGAIALYYLGLKRINASTATICELAFPLSAVIFDYFINNNALSWVQWIGAIVLIGVIMKISKTSL